MVSFKRRSPYLRHGAGVTGESMASLLPIPLSIVSNIVKNIAAPVTAGKKAPDGL
jgi:hypothetical protein